MSKVRIGSEAVEFAFSGWERMSTFRPAYAVPFALIAGVDVVAEPVGAVKGSRVGLNAPGLMKVGRWGLFHGPKTLVSVRRNVPALRLRLTDEYEGFGQVLVSTPDAEDLAAELRARGVRAA